MAWIHTILQTALKGRAYVDDVSSFGFHGFNELIIKFAGPLSASQPIINGLSANFHGVRIYLPFHPLTDHHGRLAPYGLCSLLQRASGLGGLIGMGDGLLHRPRRIGHLIGVGGDFGQGLRRPAPAGHHPRHRRHARDSITSLV